MWYPLKEKAWSIITYLTYKIMYRWFENVTIDWVCTRIILLSLSFSTFARIKFRESEMCFIPTVYFSLGLIPQNEGQYNIYMVFRSNDMCSFKHVNIHIPALLSTKTALNENRRHCIVLSEKGIVYVLNKLSISCSIKQRKSSKSVSINLWACIL